MSRALSSVGEQSVLAAETSEEWVTLLTIDHADFGAPYRYAKRRTNLTSNGNVFSAAAFHLTLPDQTPRQLPRWQIEIDMVDQTILAALRALGSAPTIQIDVVKVSAPNTIEMTSGNDYKITGYSYAGTVLVCSISMEDLIGEGFPGNRIRPSNFAIGF